MHPQLSSNFDFGRDYKVDKWLVTPKLDGMRVYISRPTKCQKTCEKEMVFGRAGKRLPNHYIRQLLSNRALQGFDGELAPPDIYDTESFKKAISLAKTYKSQSVPGQDWVFWVFNYFGYYGSAEFCAKPFADRWRYCQDQYNALPDEVKQYVKLIEPLELTLDEAMEQYSEWTDKGLEGAMLTVSDAPYTQGRCPSTKPFSLKLKAMQDCEAKIVGFTPAIYSYGKTIDRELWGTAKEELGALILQMDGYKTFHCGTGYSAEDRREIWLNQADYLGKLVTIKFQGCGSDKRPRCPVFKGIRPEEDLA